MYNKSYIPYLQHIIGRLLAPKCGADNNGKKGMATYGDETDGKSKKNSRIIAKNSMSFGQNSRSIF